MRTADARLLLAALLLLTACPSKSGEPSPASTASAKTAPSAVSLAPSATASGAPSAAPSHSGPRPARARPKPPRSFEQLTAELEKKCPAKLDGTTMEMKAELEKAGQCIKRKMIADLDAVLLPLKATNPDRFHALMKEQADWNRFVESACFIEEERQWVDFATGERSDGTMRSLAFLACQSSSVTERELYARSLAAGSTAALVARIEKTQGDGAAVKKVVADIAVKAAGFAKAPPPKTEETFSEADFPRIVTESLAMQKRAASLAQETCEGWPDLAKALGGKDACKEKAEHYYYAQGNAPTTAP